MKAPVVDYRKFRLRRIREPEYSHLLLLLGWVFYFGCYFLTENLIPAEKCHVVHCVLDDIIPFNEWFIIPYVLWYALVFGSLLYFLLYDVDCFRKLSQYIIVTQVIAMAAYVIWPSCQNLRPEVFPRENVLTKIVQFLYTFDTNTGVCPSLHVAYSLGIASVWCRRRESRWPWKTFIVLFVLLICLSTAFVKQHSVVDILAAVPVCLVAEILVFYVWNKKKEVRT